MSTRPADFGAVHADLASAARRAWPAPRFSGVPVTVDDRLPAATIRIKWHKGRLVGIVCGDEEELMQAMETMRFGADCSRWLVVREEV